MERKVGSKFPLPLLLDKKCRKKDTMGRRNRRRWDIKFRILNERIAGLNALWGGWNKAVNSSRWIHWECSDLSFIKICRNIIRWPSKLLKVPTSISDFKAILGKSTTVYSELSLGVISINEARAEAISLPKEPPNIISLLKILPEDWARKYERGENLVIRNPEVWRNMKSVKPRLGFQRGEYIKLVKRLQQLGMIKLLPITQVKVINGVHAVHKEKGKQRLIFDGRAVNKILEIPEKITLPDFLLLADWEIKEDEVVRFGKLDLDNFYHRLGVPEWLIPYLGLPPLTAEEVGMSRGTVCPTCCTLPMGLAHSVLLAQLAHLFILRKISIAPMINIKTEKEAWGWIILYIDDVVIAAKDRTSRLSESRVNNIIQECLGAYQDEGLVVNPCKLEWATSEVLGLGCVLSEEKGGIVPKEVRIKQVIGATRFMLPIDKVSAKNVECLLGHWVWFVLLHRPLYSIFFHVYKWLHTDSDHRLRQLWQSVRREFILAILFADLCTLSWKRKTAPVALAIDASFWGAGACEMKWELAHYNVDWTTGRNLKDLGEWKKVLNFPWQRTEHINVLEMRALLMALSPRLEGMRYSRMRWKIFSDSWVVVGAVRKGRSSSYMLCCLLRRLVAICMIMNASLVIEWVASEANPADVCSRVWLPGISIIYKGYQEADAGLSIVYD